MTQEDRKLLLKDLCSRLLCGVVVHYTKKEENSCYANDFVLNERIFLEARTYPFIVTIKPYLRPMSSMTKEEENEMYVAFNVYYCRYDRVNNVLDIDGDNFDFKQLSALVDWLNAHHFDYRGLIEKGLAFEAPKGMYNIN